MRLNVYSQELITDEDALREISGELGADLGACTVEFVANSFENLADLIRKAPPETGLDT